jgi:hypothetical protein
VKDGLKVNQMLQGILDPIQAQTKDAFINTFGTINQRSKSLRHHVQTLGDQSDISQANRNQ